MVSRIAIIGGAGYIGSFLYQELSKAGFLVTAYDIIKPFDHIMQCRGKDISEEEIQTYDVVIYLAGLSGRASCNGVSTEHVFQENIEDIMTLGGKMKDSQVLVYASSASLLEGSCATPAKEDYIVMEELLDSYASSMHLREQHIKGLHVPTIGLRFGTVIGISPRQRRDLVHVAMLRSAYLYNKITVHHPQCRRAILWMRDLLKAILAILLEDHHEGHQVYHLASFNTSIAEIADAVSTATVIPIELGDDAGLFGFSLDTSAIREKYKVSFSGTQDVIVKELIENIGHLCMDDITVDKQCRVCKGDNTYTILDMVSQPLANNYVNIPQRQDEYPLCLIRCKDCNHTQLNFTVKPEVMFRNYQYNSGTSLTLRNYFATLAQKIKTDTGYENARVLELACNDGSQLDEFKKIGWETWGVDPAENIVQEGRKMGHTILSGFWGVDEFDIPTPHAIVAQNVLAHVPDPIRFLKHCERVMQDHTYLYIQTSQCNMYRNGEFDTIYHEHLSFFTIASMMRAAEECGLSITEVTKQPIHGTSYLFQMRKRTAIPDHSVQAVSALGEERAVGLYTDEFYKEYQQRVMGVKTWVLSTLSSFAKRGVPIVGYGAAAKGMTLLNFFDITNIEYIADDAPMKHGKYTPGKNFLICPPTTLQKDKRELCIVVFAWNFFEEISSKITWIREGLVTYLVKPFPEQEVFILDSDGLRPYEP